MKTMRMILSGFLLFASLYANDGAIREIGLIGPQTETVDFHLYAKVCHVSAHNGSDQEGDGSPSNPWKTLGFALKNLTDAAADHRYALLVAAGTYDAHTIIMQEWIDLFGGYGPEDWKRDIFKYRSILDGMNVRRVIVGANHARLDGFVVTRGLSRTHGAGILCVDVSPLISNNFILNNLVLEPDDFDFDHIHQRGNHGGGIAVLYNAVPVIRNNVIAENKTSIGCGGGVAFYGWLRMEGIVGPEMAGNFLVGGLQPVLRNNVLVDNVSGINDVLRSRSSSGGAVLCAHEARPFIQNNIMANNRAMGRSDAGGIYSEFYAYPVIEGNWIIGNVCDDDGAAIYTMHSGQPLIRSNYIAGNWTTGGGAGGVRMSKEGRARIVDNIIVHNQSGDGVQCVDSYMELENNLIMHNPGSGLGYVQHFTYLMPSVVRNNIIRENVRTAINLREDIGHPLVIENNNVEGGFAGKGNYDQEVDMVDDVLKGVVLTVAFSPQTYTTTVVVKLSGKTGSALAGRVIWIGERWGVIKTAAKDELVVWGNLADHTAKGSECQIVSQYQLRK